MGRLGAVLLGTVSIVALSDGPVVGQIRTPLIKDIAAAARRPARTDLYGDPLPADAIARLGTVRFRHLGGVSSIAYSGDGKRLVSGGDDRKVRVWDAGTGRELALLIGPHDRVNGVAFSATDNLVAAASREGSVYLWDLHNSSEPHQLPHPSYVVAVVFSPDSKCLISGAGISEKEMSIRVWDVAERKLLQEFTRPCRIQRLALSPDGSMLAVGTGDWTVNLYRLSDGKELRRFEGHQKDLRAVSFSPDGKVLASASHDNTVRIWDVETGAQLRELDNHVLGALAVSFSPDARLLATADGQGFLRLWDAMTGKVVRWGRPIGGVNCVAFSRDGKSLAVGGDSVISLWDVATANDLRTADGHEGGLRDVIIPTDGRYVATGGWDGMIRFWDPATGREVRQIQAHDRCIWSLACAPHGSMLATTGYDGQQYWWDATTGRRLFSPAYQSQRISDVAFMPDGKRIVTADDEGTIRIWAAATCREVDRCECPGKRIRRIAVSPTGQTLAAIVGDDSVWVWDMRTGRGLGQLHTPKDDVRELAYSPNGEGLAARHTNGTIRIWSLRTGNVLRQLEDAWGTGRGLAYSPDGRLLASSGPANAVLLWEVASGQVVRRFSGHLDEVRAVAFAMNGKVLVSGSTDTTALVWDILGGNDVHGQAPAGSPKALQAVWDSLASEDAAEAFRSVRLLVRVPEHSVPLLKQKLRPVTPVPEEQIVRLIRELDGEDFAVRERATEQLERLADLAEPALRKALDGKPSAELRHRVGRLLDLLKKLDSSPARLREKRALQALEYMATPEARQLLEQLGTGAPGARLTLEAKASLERLAKRP